MRCSEPPITWASVNHYNYECTEPNPMHNPNSLELQRKFGGVFQDETIQSYMMAIHKVTYHKVTYSKVTNGSKVTNW